MQKKHEWEIKKDLVIDKSKDHAITRWHYSGSMKPKDFIKTIFDQTLATDLIRKGFENVGNIAISVVEDKNVYKIVFEEKE